MLRNRLQYGPWQIYSVRSASETHTLMKRVLDGTERDILKKDHNSLVYCIEHDGERLVVKSPTARNRRWQDRATSLWRKSKAWRAWQGMVLLQEMGIVVPEPILVAERRCCGILTNSFILYVYADGEPVTAADAPAIDSLLAHLHGQGYLRHDASTHNFLRHKEHIIMIDTTLHRPWFFPRSRGLLEHWNFRRDTPEAWYAFYQNAVPRSHLLLLAWIGRSRDALHARRHRLKKRIRTTPPLTLTLETRENTKIRD